MEVGSRKQTGEPFVMECYSEPLTPEQSAYYTEGERQFLQWQQRYQAFLSYKETNVVAQAEHVALVEYNPRSCVASDTLGNNTGVLGLAPSAAPQSPAATSAAVPSSLSPVPTTALQVPIVQQTIQPRKFPSTNAVVIAAPNQQQPQKLRKNQPSMQQLVVATQSQPITNQNNQIFVQNPGGTTNTIQIVMDPRGVIYGTMGPANTLQTSTAVSNNSMLTALTTPVNSTATIPITMASKSSSKRSKRHHSSISSQPTANVIVSSGEPSAKKRPQESTSIGGLIAGVKKPKQLSATFVDLTDDEVVMNSSDSKEVSINKMTGKTFPSLVVVARPHLSVKEYSQASINNERAVLDGKVKKVLMVNASSFTEWLLQQGLLRSEQSCMSHTDSDGSPIKLKLGMYSDASKFPYSGGYVWISSCCPQQFVSVFSGSIFEGAPHPPNVLLKLLYHWACHTSIQNVVQWVKVENSFIKSLYTNLRAVCTAALHNKYQKMGGNKKRIQVGVISLGTTAGGSTKQVKVEVLGVLDSESKNLRIRAIEPVQEGERNYKKRFMKILEPLHNWVEKDSVILTDTTVDKETLNTMGYSTVYQVSANDTNSANYGFSNHQVMDYLRRIVPRMFQNTLSLLSRQIIQQFLDELVWRERWGPIPSRAFSSIIEHLAEQTKLNTGGTLLNRLTKIAANPFKNWKYDRWAANCKLNNTLNVPGERVTCITIGGNNITSTNIDANTPSIPIVSTPTFDVITPLVMEDKLETYGEKTKGVKVVSVKGQSRKVRRSNSNTSLEEPSLNKVIKAESPVPPVVVPSPPPPPVPSPPSPPASRPSSRSSVHPSSRSSVTSRPSTSRSSAPSPDETEGTSPMIQLEPYFYASKTGHPDCMINTEFPEDVKCVICEAPFRNNIKLMDHLIKHALNKLPHERKDICKLCCKVIPTPSLMKFHVSRHHNDDSITPLTCLICSIKLKDKSTFIHHMTRIHYEMEMPYICHICSYRTSIHNDMVNHFLNVHDGAWSGVCPYCFKVIDFYKDKELPQNQMFFIIHIQKHQLSPLTKKCSKCSMWFINKTVLDEHEAAVHVSCRNLPGAVRYEGANYTMIPCPTEDPTPLRSERIKPPVTSSNVQVIAFRPLKIDTSPFTKKLLCSECEAEINEHHFLAQLSCTKCSYQTCCQRAMTEHNSSAHFTYTPRFTLGKPIKLPELIHCPCSFSTKFGHVMAKHMVTCRKVTCYSSKEVAQQHKLSAASSNDAMLSQWLTPYTQNNKTNKPTDEPKKSILNSLGLVRKPSTDETSEDIMESETSSIATVTALRVTPEPSTTPREEQECDSSSIIGRTTTKAKEKTQELLKIATPPPTDP